MSCGTLKINALEETFTNQKASDSLVPRELFCLAYSQQAGFILQIGGMKTESLIGLKAVHRYTLETDRWDYDVPPLNKLRENGSACAIGTTFYVFCGLKSSGTAVASVEKLVWDSREETGWQLFTPKGACERESPAVVVLD